MKRHVNRYREVTEMFKKMLVVLLAATMIASFTAIALAAPARYVVPRGYYSAHRNADRPSRVRRTGKSFARTVLALKDQLASEREYDRDMISKIHSLKGFYTPDPAARKAYESEMAPLQANLRALERKLEQLQTRLNKAQSKGSDTTKIQAAMDKVNSDIATVNAQIAAVDAKYPDMKNRIKANDSARSTLKAFREQLKAEYAKLAPYIKQAADLTAQMHDLIAQMENAIAAGDLAKASDLLAQVNSVVAQLQDNINQRITIRQGISNMLDDYKASLTK